MNNRLIVCMRLMILHKPKIKELMILLKEMTIFFVLNLSEIDLIMSKVCNSLIYIHLNISQTAFQFFVSNSRFFVMIAKQPNFNSLYRVFNSSYLTGSYQENAQYLYLTKPTCIENCTFLYMIPNQRRK
jgi:hypothetical protein